MGLLNINRRMHLRQKQSIREIARMANAVTDLIERARVRHWFKNQGEGRTGL